VGRNQVRGGTGRSAKEHVNTALGEINPEKGEGRFNLTIKGGGKTKKKEGKPAREGWN